MSARRRSGPRSETGVRCEFRHNKDEYAVMKHVHASDGGITADTPSATSIDGQASEWWHEFIIRPLTSMTFSWSVGYEEEEQLSTVHQDHQHQQQQEVECQQQHQDTASSTSSCAQQRLSTICDSNRAAQHLPPAQSSPTQLRSSTNSSSPSPAKGGATMMYPGSLKQRSKFATITSSTGGNAAAPSSNRNSSSSSNSSSTTTTTTSSSSPAVLGLLPVEALLDWQGLDASPALAACGGGGGGISSSSPLMYQFDTEDAKKSD